MSLHRLIKTQRQVNRLKRWRLFDIATRKFVELGSPERPAEVVLQHGAEKRWSDFSRRLNQWRS
jgi:hypothetical protein